MSLDPHASRVAAGICPGALYVRVAAASGPLLDAHDLPLLSTAAGLSTNDQLTAARWLGQHRDDAVHVYVFDGDSGECLATIIVHGPDHPDSP